MNYFVTIFRTRFRMRHSYIHLELGELCDTFFVCITQTNKSDIVLATNQSALISPHSAGVIVKHDTSMIASPLQVTDKIRKSVRKFLLYIYFA